MAGLLLFFFPLCSWNSCCPWVQLKKQERIMKSHLLITQSAHISSGSSLVHSCKLKEHMQPEDMRIVTPRCCWIADLDKGLQPRTQAKPLLTWVAGGLSPDDITVLFSEFLSVPVRTAGKSQKCICRLSLQGWMVRGLPEIHQCPVHLCLHFWPSSMTFYCHVPRKPPVYPSFREEKGERKGQR